MPQTFYQFPEKRFFELTLLKFATTYDKKQQKFLKLFFKIPLAEKNLTNVKHTSLSY